jgi:membrane protein
MLSGYGAVYGTFAALPLFMLWLNWSWLIVLFGAEISFAYQNAAHYESEAEEIQISTKDRRVLSLLVIQRITKNFVEGNPPLNAADIAQQLGIPVRIVRDLIYDLLNSKIIIETLTPDVREVAYHPAIDPAKITISFVIDTLEKYGHKVSIDKETQDLININQIVESFYQDIRNSASNKTLRDL